MLNRSHLTWLWVLRVYVYPMHWQAHVRGTHKVCHPNRGRCGTGPGLFLAASFTPSLPPSLGLCSSENPPLPFILNCSQWRLFLRLKAAVISCLKPLLSLHLLSLLSSLSLSLVQEKESALWPFCHPCALLICCNLMLVPAILLVSLSTSGYNFLIAKCFSVFRVVGLRTH